MRRPFACAEVLCAARDENPRGAEAHPSPAQRHVLAVLRVYAREPIDLHEGGKRGGRVWGAIAKTVAGGPCNTPRNVRSERSFPER